VPRTTPELVRTVVDAPAADDLTAAVLSANELVTEVCVPLGYTSTRLELIERYLAAHFYLVWHPGNLIEAAGSVRQQIISKVDLGLNLTHQGQQAALLDTRGGLASLNATAAGTTIRPKRSVVWLGKDPNA
jgi:hypothetical protein